MSPPLCSSFYIILHIFAFAREAQIIFKAGQNRDGYFDTDNLLQQVNKAIDILRVSLRAGPKDFFYLTMCLAIKGMCLMRYQLDTW